MRGKLIFAPPTFLGRKFQKVLELLILKILIRKKSKTHFPFPTTYKH